MHSPAPVNQYAMNAGFEIIQTSLALLHANSVALERTLQQLSRQLASHVTQAMHSLALASQCAIHVGLESMQQSMGRHLAQTAMLVIHSLAKPA